MDCPDGNLQIDDQLKQAIWLSSEGGGVGSPLPVDVGDNHGVVRGHKHRGSPREGDSSESIGHHLHFQKVDVKVLFLSFKDHDLCTRRFPKLEGRGEGRTLGPLPPGGNQESSVTRQVRFLEEGGTISPSNFSLIAETMSCQEESAGERGESSAGVAGGRSGGKSSDSSGSEMSDLERTLKDKEASSLILLFSSCLAGGPCWRSNPSLTYYKPGTRAESSSLDLDSSQHIQES